MSYIINNDQENFNKEYSDKAEKIKKLKGVVIHCRMDYFNKNENNEYSMDLPSKIIDDKELNSKNSVHYVMDSYNIFNTFPIDKQCNAINGGKNTYINKALYENDANKYTVSFFMNISIKDTSYEYDFVEKKFIKRLAIFLVDNDLEPNNVMRCFDLNRTPSPIHLLNDEKWHKFIEMLEKTYEFIKNEKDPDEYLTKENATYSDEGLAKFIKNHFTDYDEYAKSFSPDNRGIEELKNYKDSEIGETKTFSTKNNNSFTYTINTNIRNTNEHCERDFDTLIGNISPNSLEVEPIYPDLIVPPDDSITLVNSLTEKMQISNDNILSIEELEKREKIFNINDYKDAEKKIKGKPVNNNDPYPVDIKIKELENHMPKVKIDKIDFTLQDCNHPGSIIGPAVAKNFAMLEDALISISKRAESRIVRLENILSTITRNLFRTASRIQINCTYYGGQDVYSKYGSIRCLHNDRINDGQSMTLDQCLSCTRYEPILGQVYAILDETGMSVSQVLDDMQMSYMSMDDYKKFTRTEEICDEKEFANLKQNGKIPKSFEEINKENKNSFKMDWTKTVLETQKDNITEYKAEKFEAKKPVLKSESQAEHKEEFKDISEAENYELLEFNSEDYTFEDFGQEYNISTNGFSGNSYGNAIRKKIVEYAENALKLCQDGKAGYSQTYRMNHLDKAINGISYWDCSSLLTEAYKNAGIPGLGTCTYDEYPNCLPSTGGEIFLAKDIYKYGKKGDCIWFSNAPNLPKTQEELNSINIGTIYHTGVYIGDGKMIEAATSNAPLNQQIRKSDLVNRPKFFAFGRPKGLVEADKKVNQISKEYEYIMNINADSFKFVDMRKNVPPSTLNEIKAAAKVSGEEFGIDPVFMLAIFNHETGFDIRAVSPYTGAGALGGVLPTYFDFAEIKDQYNIKQAVRGSTKMFKENVKFFEDSDAKILLAMIGYAVGASYVKKVGITDWYSYLDKKSSIPYTAESNAVGEIIKGYQVFRNDNDFCNF